MYLLKKISLVSRKASKGHVDFLLLILSSNSKSSVQTQS